MLPETDAVGYSTPQIMMTLAAITYSGTTQAQIQSQLRNQRYATKGQWNLVWGPVSTLYGFAVNNLMYVAQLSDSNTYAVAIRGTDLDAGLSTLIDIFEDLDVSDQFSWCYPPIDGACIAGGTLDGLTILTSLTDPTSGETLLSFLSPLSEASIYVTGHSLGGCLATVLAPWLANQLIQENTILPYTFAAPTAGNQQFADWYNQQFTSYRYYNSIDVIPMAWDNLAGIDDLFTDGPDCPWLVSDSVDGISDWLYYCGVSYKQTNGIGTPLPGTSTQSPDWFTEMGNQHEHNMYLTLLNAPNVDTPSVMKIKPRRYNPILMRPQKPTFDEQPLPRLLE